MFVALAAEAQNNLSFKTEELKKVAAELKLEGLDTLKIGYTFIQKNNHQLVVRKAENGMVEHIGIQLFPEAYRQQANGAVLDFLESGLLCNTYKESIKVYGCQIRQGKLEPDAVSSKIGILLCSNGQ